MIRRLKRRFVVTATLSLLGVLLMVLCTVNLLFWHHSIETSDNLLNYLAENDGGFGPQDDYGGKPPAPKDIPDSDRPHQDASERDKKHEKKPPLGFLMTQETAFRTRCFSVIYSNTDDASSVRTDRIAAVSDDEALAYAERALQRNRPRGMMDIYRYYVEKRDVETVVVFLDCSDVLVNTWFLLGLSAVILVFCLVAMYILLWCFSGRVVRPVVESMEKQKQFIADAGHELKTPLTIINADAAVLTMTGGENEWVDSIRNQTRRLDRLVHEMLDLSRMDSDAPLTMATFSLSDAAEDTVGAFFSPSSARNITLKADIHPDVRHNGNEEALRRLISILMDNAVKYTSEGGSITFSLRRSGHSVIIETRNDCAPLDKKHLGRLFERFYRGDPSRSSSGYGIGLSIAQEIVHRHHGKIGVACPDPGIIVFTVTLPG